MAISLDFFSGSADSLILLGGGLYLLFVRKSMVAKVVEPARKAKIDLLFKLAGPAMMLGGIVLLSTQLGNADNRVRRYAQEFSAGAPRMVDDQTRLDRATAGPGHRVVLHHTVTRLKANEVDRSAWQRSVVPQLRQNVLNSRMNDVLGRGITLVYRYSGSDGVLIDEVVFVPPAGQGR